MTFEPCINMPDAVRQPRPFRAQTAAWLSVVTADIPMQVWYVYNHIMYQRWVLEDTTSALNGQILELAPSLLGSVTTVQPVVTAVEGNEWIRARAWRDAAFEAQKEGNLCVHLAVASVGDRPGSFAIRIDGVCGGSGEPPCPKGLNATHLFNQYYSVPVIRKQGTTAHFVNDVITPGSTSVYALGCDAWRLGGSGDLGVRNLVDDPSFEETELPLTPGFITCPHENQYPASTFKGVCKVEDKHAGSWGLTQELAGSYDGRFSFFVDSILPHTGRHAGRVWLPSAEPITFGLPGHTTNLDGVTIQNDTEYSVQLWARSYPAGMTAEITVGSWVTESLAPRTALGLPKKNVYRASSPRNEAHRLNGAWAQINATIPKQKWPNGATLNIQVAAAAVAFPAGSVWLDDVAVVCVAGCPPPDTEH